MADLDRVRSEVQRVWPDVVIHTAAYTAVDQAETNVDEAFRINADGSRNVALAAEEVGAKVCYISTDYVFDGTLERPYREFDRTGPMSVYGQSKLAGEVLTQTLCSRYFIVRTASEKLSARPRGDSNQWIYRFAAVARRVAAVSGGDWGAG